MEFLTSLSSSILTYSLLYPLDSIKTNMQVSKLTMFSSVKNIYQTSGIKGYYRGLCPTLYTYPLFWGIFFQIKEKKYFDNSIANTFLASNISSFITNPLFVIKTRLQTIQPSSQKSLFSMMASIKNEEGIKGYTKGFGHTILNNSKLCILFPLCDKMREKGFDIVTASIISRLVANYITFPTDTIRTIKRSEKSDISTIDIIKRYGLKGCYRGVGIYNILSVSNFVILMCIREQLKDKI